MFGRQDPHIRRNIDVGTYRQPSIEIQEAAVRDVCPRADLHRSDAADSHLALDRRPFSDLYACHSSQDSQPKGVAWHGEQNVYPH
jgi:hypothetical protein